MSESPAFVHPPRHYSLLPFWFWNDALDADEIRRQIADFEAHGVYGFVIHPRVGLPREIGWMSDAMLNYMEVAIDEARRRGMTVVLYDEGMYPSGSSSGQVVTSDPTLACRCLAVECAETELAADSNVVRSFTHHKTAYRIVDRKADSYIRGLHYVDEARATEDEPPAADILNPRATQSFIRHVHEKLAARFRQHFGRTILGIFTDEPSALGRCRKTNVFPFTTGILPELQRITGHDFTPDLPALFFDDLPSAAEIRDRYRHAIRLRLNETWYAPLQEWCDKHGLWLMGHPDAGDEIGVQRYFHVPGQDLVWRWVEPENQNSIEGPESTQGKCSSSAMLHAGRSRNSNELAGAFGHQTTFAEVQWLANWCLVRGVNLLIPHAFYYSIRGPRKDERPPQIGPHTLEWEDGTFKRFADSCRRLSWLNATCEHVCKLAILTHDDRCPWRAAKVCFEHQFDFNYLEPTVLQDARVDPDAVTVKRMRYALVIVEGDRPLDEPIRTKLGPMIAAGHVVRFGRQRDDGISAAGDERTLIEVIRGACAAGLSVRDPSPGLRVRHMRHATDDFVLFFNERLEAIVTAISSPTFDSRATWIDLVTGDESPATQALSLAGYECRLLRIPTC